MNRDISNNQDPFSTHDKSQNHIKDSYRVNSISVAVNAETISQETLNLSEAVASSSSNTVKANKTNPSKVSPFIAVRPRKNNQSKNKKIYILGEKNLNGWEMSKKLKKADVYVGHFAGAKVRCMRDHMKPSLREKPDHIVLHVGTNDLVSDRPPYLIPKSIVDVPPI